MIMIDVLVPPLYEVYDFEVDESMEGQSLIDGIENLISKKYNIRFAPFELELFDYSQAVFIQKKETLKSQNVVNGTRLIMI